MRNSSGASALSGSRRSKAPRRAEWPPRKSSRPTCAAHKGTGGCALWCGWVGLRLGVVEGQRPTEEHSCLLGAANQGRLARQSRLPKEEEKHSACMRRSPTELPHRQRWG